MGLWLIVGALVLVGAAMVMWSNASAKAEGEQLAEDMSDALIGEDDFFEEDIEPDHTASYVLGAAECDQEGLYWIDVLGGPQQLLMTRIPMELQLHWTGAPGTTGP